jgi:hypothetical protein
MKNLLNKLILQLYIWKAKRNYYLTGKQTFVVPVVNYGKRKYSLMTNDLHKAYNYKAKKLGKPQISFQELLAMCVFKTSQGTTKMRSL